MNQVQLVGRLCKEAEIRKVGKGKSMTYITIAVEGYFDKATKKVVTDYIPVTVWGQLAERLTKVVKGSLVAVTGRVACSSYEKDGQRVWKTEIVAEEIQFLAKPKGA